MDPHCLNITISLYRQERERGPEYLIHTYSLVEGSRGRISFLTKAAAVLGGMEQAGERLRFPCGAAHQSAAKRIFLEVCKMGSDTDVAPKPLSTPDKKSGGIATAESLGGGEYRVSAGAAIHGLKKLAEMEGEEDRVRFGCGQAHDAAIGLLLPRALNVRAVLREEEAAASRGLLVAPSAQK